MDLPEQDARPHEGYPRIPMGAGVLQPGEQASLGMHGEFRDPEDPVDVGQGGGLADEPMTRDRHARGRWHADERDVPLFGCLIGMQDRSFPDLVTCEPDAGAQHEDAGQGVGQLEVGRDEREGEGGSAGRRHADQVDPVGCEHAACRLSRVRFARIVIRVRDEMVAVGLHHAWGADDMDGCVRQGKTARHHAGKQARLVALYRDQVTGRTLARERPEVVWGIIADDDDMEMRIGAGHGLVKPPCFRFPRCPGRVRTPDAKASMQHNRAGKRCSLLVMELVIV